MTLPERTSLVTRNRPLVTQAPVVTRGPVCGDTLPRWLTHPQCLYPQCLYPQRLYPM